MITFLHCCVSIVCLAGGYYWGFRDRESWKDEEIRRLKNFTEHLLKNRQEYTSELLPPEMRTNTFADEFKKNQIQPPSDGQKKG